MTTRYVVLVLDGQDVFLTLAGSDPEGYCQREGFTLIDKLKFRLPGRGLLRSTLEVVLDKWIGTRVTHLSPRSHRWARHMGTQIVGMVARFAFRTNFVPPPYQPMFEEGE